MNVYADTALLRSIIERRHKVKFWGSPHMITPRLITEVFGDGKKLISIEPTDWRPNYYVVRVDSSWSTSNWEHDDEKVEPREWLDKVLDAIGDQFGDCYYDDWAANKPFPVLSSGSGVSWGEMGDDVAEEIRKRMRAHDQLTYYRREA